MILAGRYEAVVARLLARRADAAHGRERRTEGEGAEARRREPAAARLAPARPAGR